ncbi:hypothetical protein [Rubrivirga sp.]|uniref:hypothetical protein n=1 Tax=Rubrivirga sp. TaxID=1885344 RepID=UPI003C756B94
MRTALLFFALAAAVSAQEGERPTSIEDPDLLLSSIGQGWEDVETSMPIPDSGAVATGAGSVWWPAADDEIAWVRADVRDNRIVQLSIKPGEDVSAENLTQFAQGLKGELGPAGPNGFYDATDWTEFNPASGRILKSGIKVQVAMLVPERVLILRLTPGSF